MQGPVLVLVLVVEELSLEVLRWLCFSTATQVEQKTLGTAALTIPAGAEIGNVQLISRKSDEGDHTASILLGGERER